MKRKELPVKRLGLEIFSIVFAVLLALTLDSWQEKTKKDREIKRALTDIMLEIQSYTDFGPAENVNQTLLDSLTINIRRYAQGSAASFTMGFARPEARNLAWTSARENGIASGFDRELFLDLAEIYVEYDRLNYILEFHAEFILKADPDMPEFTKARHVARHLNRSIFRMDELQRKSIDLLKKYEGSPFVPSNSDPE